jgi:predicted kinase
MKRVIVLQGVSGSGKSHYARKLLQEYANDNPRIISTDDFFNIDTARSRDDYKFDPSKLGEAHAWCFCEYILALQGTADDFIIVDNTNASAEELSPYMLAASAFGAKAFIVRVDCDLEVAARRNVHNVPTNAISRQAERIRQSNDVIARRGWVLQFIDGDK